MGVVGSGWEWLRVRGEAERHCNQVHNPHPTTTNNHHQQNKVNQVVLWDRIVRTPAEAAALSVPSLKQKYAFVDRGQGLRGRPLRLTLAWSVMPRVGALFLRSKSFEAGALPEEYVF